MNKDGKKEDSKQPGFVASSDNRKEFQDAVKFGWLADCTIGNTVEMSFACVFVANVSSSILIWQSPMGSHFYHIELNISNFTPMHFEII